VSVTSGPSKPKNDSRYLAATFLKTHFDELSTVLQRHLKPWGTQGWRVVGREPHLRIEVSLPQSVQKPRHPVRAVRVGGRWIKPAVTISHAHLRRPRGADGSSPSSIGLVRAMAPGARVRVGRGQFQEFVGIAAVFEYPDKSKKVLTCGHARAFDFSGEIVPGDDPNGDAIANLDRNFLQDPNPLDAALCTLTDAGLALLKDSANAPTWRFKSIKTPSVTDNSQQSVFWQTHDGDDSALTAPVLSFSGQNAALFGPTGPQTGFVETSHGVIPGDSGSLLSLGASLYGLCSGFIGFTAFFTPIASVVARLKSQGTICTIYQPGS